MTKEQGNQLKALGVLAVVAAHVGYFLFGDHNFLFPFSNYAGVAVDLFYFLSAYGLAVAASEAKTMTAIVFYKKRLLRLAPFIWITLAIFFALDFFVYAKVYDIEYLIRSFFLIFPTSDLWNDVNSPLWYITPLVAYSLSFPYLFRKGKPLLSALLFLAFGYVLTKLTFIATLFELHYFAFAAGILFAGYAEWFKVNRITTVFLILLVGAGSLWSGTGTRLEPYACLLLAFALVLIFRASSMKSKFLGIIGTYSFEIYLLHWPLMSRFDVLSGLRPYPWVWLVAWVALLTLPWYLLRRPQVNATIPT